MVCDLEERARAGGPRKAFAELGHMYGLSYNQNTLLWSRGLLAIVRVPDCVYWDAMHVLHASGGVAQYECNQLAMQIRRSGGSLAMLDEFAAKVVWRKCQQRLPRTFFQDRIVDDLSSSHEGLCW